MSSPGVNKKKSGTAVKQALWERFEKEADTKKQELLKIATLHLGMMGALVAFGARECFGGGEVALKPAALLLAVSAVGFGLAIMACYSIAELATHVVRSWDNAVKARKGHPELDRIFSPVPVAVYFRALPSDSNLTAEKLLESVEAHCKKRGQEIVKKYSGAGAPVVTGATVQTDVKDLIDDVTTPIGDKEVQAVVIWDKDSAKQVAMEKPKESDSGWLGSVILFLATCCGFSRWASDSHVGRWPRVGRALFILALGFGLLFLLGALFGGGATLWKLIY